MSDQITNICAIGAGAMGASTAFCFAVAGYDVMLYDLTEESLTNGMRNIQAALKTYQQHDLIQASNASDVMSRIKTTTSMEEASHDADFLIESIVEVLDVKRSVFAKLDAICPEHTLFATNTSGLSPTAIADAIKRKDKFVVTHFWNPPHLIPLVEVVPGEHTSQETVDSAYDLMLKIGKRPVRLNQETPGFVGNRLQLALLREALHIVATGIASIEDVDAVVELTLGRRLAATGPLKSADLGGLDIFKNIFSYLGSDLCRDTDIPALLNQVVAAGHLGAKSGKGFYSWPEDKLASARAQRTDELCRHLVNDKK